MKSFYTIGLLILSNTFMTFAWYGHLKFREMKWFETLGIAAIVLISWAIAFFEYCFQVPANRIGLLSAGTVEVKANGCQCSAKTCGKSVKSRVFVMAAQLLIGHVT